MVFLVMGIKAVNLYDVRRRARRQHTNALRLFREIYRRPTKDLTTRNCRSHTVTIDYGIR